ncbi:MAG TPA: PAS domain S-box protein, partial [Candidatus Latescibacteria bacterium]|nr:PAS domain S-box protein [Candidatus Latescibacterota bacterium]
FCIFELRTPEKPFGPEQVFLDDLGQVNLEDHIGLLEQLAADLRTAQTRLMGSEAKYRALFENAPDMMMLCDPVTGRILDVNRAVVERLGYERDAVLRMTLRDLHPQKDHATLSKVIGPSITDPVGSSPMQLVGSGKQVCSVEAAFSLVPFAGSTVLQAIYHDVTGFQTAQLALREAEELARIGRMASAVAHEIRNPLSAIVSGIRLLTSSKRSEEERSLIFDTILVESERLDSTLNDFLQFARPRNPRRKPENLEEMLQDLVRIIWSDKDAVGSVVPRITVSPDLPLVNCDGDQIRQVFWNVILNAIQAMAG